VSDVVDPAADPELAALAKRDAAIAAALAAERRGRDDDFQGPLDEAWDARAASDATWDLAALDLTVGGPIEVHRRDGTVYTGTVRSEPDGKGWWHVVASDAGVEFEDGTVLAFDDIVSIAPVPDADHTHDLGPVDDTPED
jgi:hypothetical protein